jgi:sugar lactone lactonase YvrE
MLGSLGHFDDSFMTHLQKRLQPNLVLVLGSALLWAGSQIAMGQGKAATPPTQQTVPRLEVIAPLSSPPGNITLTPQGRILISLHQFFAPTLRVVEITPQGTVPFPNVAWNQVSSDRVTLDTILGLQAANAGVWLLDNGMRGGTTPKLVEWDTTRNQLAKLIYLPAPITVKNSFVNDLAVDLTHQATYIADPAGGDNAALIVVDLTTGMSRRVLQGDRSVIPENLDLVIDGHPVQIKLPDGKLIRPKIGVNPIALDHQHEWLYYGPMHGTSMYRIKTADLRNPNLTATSLAQRVERYSGKPICDGIAIDPAGNIYLGDLAANAIGVITSDRRYQKLFSDARLSWVDAFSVGNDGYVYTVANQLHRTAFLNAGNNQTKPPFYLFRFKSLR